MTPGLEPGAPVPIAVDKYDGRRRFVVWTRCLRATPELLILLGEPGRVFETPAGARRLATTTLEYFPTARWWNIVSFYDATTGDLLRHFCNAIAPARWDGQLLRYVDLDLDLVVTPAGTVSIEDLADFRHHARLWRYPATTRHQALLALRELRALALAGRPPFTGEPFAAAFERAASGEEFFPRQLAK